MTASLRKRAVWLRVPAFVLPIAPLLVVSADEIGHLCDAVDAALGGGERALGLAPR